MSEHLARDLHIMAMERLTAIFVEFVRNWQAALQSPSCGGRACKLGS